MTEPSDIPPPEIIEMTEGESIWALWNHSSDVDTGGHCDCGHEGLGPSRHAGDCRGANYVLTHKVRELFIELDVQWRWAHAVQCQAKLSNGECELGNGCLWPNPV